MQYRHKRYIAYIFITIFSIGLPFIQINQNQIFLLSFDHKELHLLGSIFSTQEFYVMPFLLILLFVGIFFITTLLGRFWCGWCCPQTIFRTIYRDLIEGVILKLNKIANKQTPQNLSPFANKIKKVFSLLLITLICFSASAVLLFYFVPPYDFFAYLRNFSEHPVLLGFWIGIGLFFTFDIVSLKENFCIYVCPYSRVQSVLFDQDTQSVIYDVLRGGAIYHNLEKIPLPLKTRNPSAECIECQKCVRVCPTHIDIRAGMQLECINCLECVDACSSVMGKFNKKTLIAWSSQNAITQKSKIKYWRNKTIGYLVILGITIALAFIMGAKRDDIVLNIAHSGVLYTIHKNSTITNEYVLLVQNTTHQDLDLSLQIDHPNIAIIRPQKSFNIQANKKKRVVLVLKYIGAINALSSDQSIPFQLTLRSQTQPNLSTTKESVFIYPKNHQN